MSTEIDYQGKRIEVIPIKNVESACNAGEKVRAKLYFALDENGPSVFIVLKDKNLGQAIFKLDEEGQINFENALDEAVDVLCNEKGCAGGAKCIKKKHAPNT